MIVARGIFFVDTLTQKSSYRKAKHKQNYLSHFLSIALKKGSELKDYQTHDGSLPCMFHLAARRRGLIKNPIPQSQVIWARHCSNLYMYVAKKIVIHSDANQGNNQI